MEVEGGALVLRNFHAKAGVSKGLVGISALAGSRGLGSGGSASEVALTQNVRPRSGRQLHRLLRDSKKLCTLLPRAARRVQAARDASGPQVAAKPQAVAPPLGALYSQCEPMTKVSTGAGSAYHRRHVRQPAR